MSRPIQLHFFEQRAALLAATEKAQAEVAAIDKELAELRKQAEEGADFNGDLLPGLRVQQLQLEVDLAGTKSRIEACERLLKGTELPDDRRGQIVDTKIAAEIDLASFEARRNTLEGFVQQVKRSISLSKEIAATDSRRQSAARRLGPLGLERRKCEANIGAFQPLPLVDNKVIIYPVKWTN